MSRTERQISINASLLVLDWKSAKINLIDTPGYTDFTGEVKSSLRITDTAIVFLKGVEGIEVGTEITWQYTREQKNAAIFVVNKLDNDNADFDAVLKSARERFSHDVIPVQFPVKQGPGFESVLDVLRMKLVTSNRGAKGKATESEIPPDLKARADELHEQLIEQIAETDEALLNTFFEKGTLSTEEITRGLRQGIRLRKIFPLFCIASQSGPRPLSCGPRSPW